jgi:hypothetical protein
LLVNQHHVVIAVVIAYHLRVLRKRSKMVSSYFVNTVKRYVASHASFGILHLSVLIFFPIFPSFQLLMCISITTLQLLQSKQYCGICKKIWHHTDGGNWVCCDECHIWVHVECDLTCNNMEDLENTDYFCPDCKSKRKTVVATEKMNTSNSSECASTSKEKLSGMIPVCCNGEEALYIPEKHMILCQCKSCKERMMSLNEWEKHTGSRKKNWKMSIKLKSTGEPLINLLDDIPCGTSKSSTPGIKKEELLQLQANAYSPVCAKWTTERCAVCRWVEDWDYNKIIICNRYSCCHGFV